MHEMDARSAIAPDRPQILEIAIEGEASTPPKAPVVVGRRLSVALTRYRARDFLQFWRPRPREPMLGPGLKTLLVAFAALYLIGGWLVPAAISSARHNTAYSYALCKRGVVMLHLWKITDCR